MENIEIKFDELEIGFTTLKEMATARKAWWESTEGQPHAKRLEQDKAVVRAFGDEILRGENNNLLLRSLEKRPWLLIEIFFTIVDKYARTVPFFLNEVQREFIEIIEKHGFNKNHPYVILKGRQQGFTSLITAIQLSFMICRENFNGCTLADDSSKTIKLFEEKGKQVYERISDERFKPEKARDNLNMLSFTSPNCSWHVGVASADAARGETLGFLHCSEVATFPCLVADMQAGAIQSVIPDGAIVYESTAHGFNQFKELWDKPSNIRCFFAWWKTAEYRSKYLDTLNDLPDEWIRERVNWLRTVIGLEEEQIAWYVDTYKSLVNPELIRQEYPCTPEEAFLASGACIFDLDKITTRMAELRNSKTDRIGYFSYKKKPAVINGEAQVDMYDITNIQWIDDINGYIRLHKPPKCKARKKDALDKKKVEIAEMSVNEAEREGLEIVGYCPYSIGGDTAGEGSDFFTGKVIDNITCEEAATLEICKIDEDLYSDQIYCLGKMYNDALVALEVNFSYAPTKNLIRCQYPNLYVRKAIEETAQKSTTAKFGFNTNPQTRPLIIAEFQRKFRDNPSIINDEATLTQMMVFVKNENGRPEAAKGQHDDLVMGEMIAQFVAGSDQAQHAYALKKVEEVDEFAAFFGFSKESGDETEFNGIRGYCDYD